MRRRVSRFQSRAWFILGCVITLYWLWSVFGLPSLTVLLVGAASAAAAAVGILLMNRFVLTEYDGALRRGLLGRSTANDKAGAQRTQLAGAVTLALLIVLGPAVSLPVAFDLAFAALGAAMSWSLARRARRCERAVQAELDAGQHADAQIQPDIVGWWRTARPYQRIIWSAAVLSLGFVFTVFVAATVWGWTK